MLKGRDLSAELICYCFNYSRQDIERDVLEHQGESTILARIMAAKQAGGCECQVKNPKGT